MTLQGCAGGGSPAGTNDDAAPARYGIEHRVQVPLADSRRYALKQGEVHRADDIAVPCCERLERAVAEADAVRVVNRLEPFLGHPPIHHLPAPGVLTPP